MKTIAGIFSTHDEAKSAQEDLVNAGFDKDRIEVKRKTLLNRNILDDLQEYGIPEPDAHLMAESVRRGSSALLLTCEDKMIDDAMSILEAHNPTDLDLLSTYYNQSGFQSYDVNAAAYSDEQEQLERDNFSRAFSRAEATIPVVEEKASIGKREVTKGGVRVFTEVTERPVSQQVNLKSEDVELERTRVNRPLDARDMGNAFTEGSMEITEHAEEPIISKEARVVEEVHIKKDVTEQPETVTTSERRRDVRTERIDERENRPPQ